mmetsp:Transcript_16904/g.47182  ORF Transcript_16904/g.47182 Transcript_16904/m.47182 type:complete len:309 (+) Transcript_16904:919-1845(+)
MEGRKEEGLGHKITVRDAVHAVWAHPALEAKLVGEELPVNTKRVPRQGPAAEWEGGDAGQEVGEALVIALPGGGVAEEPVAPADGHGRLEVGEAGHEHVRLALGAVGRHADELVEAGADDLELIVKPQPGVGGHLVVPGAAGVQLPAHRANQLHQPALICCVDVLIAGLDLKRACSPLLGHRGEPFNNGCGLVVIQEAGPVEGFGVRLRPRDVLSPHPLVERQRFVELVHQRVGGTGEATSPELLWSIGGDSHRGYVGSQRARASRQRRCARCCAVPRSLAVAARVSSQGCSCHGPNGERHTREGEAE